MGYSYDLNNRLCCDICGTSGGVRKHRCPFGWCQSIALCKACKRQYSYITSKQYHRNKGCEDYSNAFREYLDEKARMLREGKFVRTSAIQEGSGVRVTFSNGKDEIDYFMASNVYQAIPLRANATPEDYETYGKISKYLDK